MAVDEEVTAEHAFGLAYQPTQRLMIGMIVTLNAPSRLGEAQLLGVDLFAVRDDAGDCPETHANPQRAGIDEIRQSVGKHRRVELIGLTVDVDIGPRKTGRKKRGPEPRGGREQLVDKAVLGLPQSPRIEPRDSQEISGIFRTAMR